MRLDSLGNRRIKNYQTDITFFVLIHFSSIIGPRIRPSFILAFSPPCREIVTYLLNSV